MNTDGSYMFNSLLKMDNLDISSIDTGNTNNMRGLFYKSISLEEIDVSSFNTSSVTNMSYMFAGGEANYNSDYTTFSYDYRMALKSIKGLTKFNTSKVTNMAAMFFSDNNLKNVDVSSFDTSNVTDMSSMFAGNWNYGRFMMYLDEIKGLEKFNTSKVTNMVDMFAMNQNLASIDVSHFDTHNVTNMEFMFGACPSLESVDVSSFNTSKVTNMRWMFGLTNLSKIDLGNFDMTNVTNTEAMLYRVSSVKMIESLKTPKVFPTDSSVTITLPKTLYNPTTGTGYSTLDNTSPTSTWLKTKYTITNLVQNGSFENSLNNWTAMNYEDSSITYHTASNDYKKFGNSSLKRLASSNTGDFSKINLAI